METEHNTSIIHYTKKDIQRMVTFLQKKGFTITILKGEMLKEFIMKNIPDDCIVGVGESLSSGELGITSILSEKDNNVFYSWDGNQNYNRSLDTFETHPLPGYFLSLGSITQDGNLVVNDFKGDFNANNSLPKNFIVFVLLENPSMSFPSITDTHNTIILDTMTPIVNLKVIFLQS